ncbi:hypothetical protein A28LD_0027 [Idiomarina sp. A28L]|uniref:hypothetical protein n=1 Tax=Idiomarina sp. A28L TaxID=1036674 RepID=UPI0002138E60|nr:hypothetical protein [Idiomarina sp. A28L]EGN76295.1 hypothetical protein A28LD_0027 [Idiomarina sp. A28L]
MNTKKSLITLLACVGALVVLTACSDSKITRTNFNYIDMGMHFSEVKNMIGEPTWCDNFERPNECRWGTEEKHIYVIFAARRVVDKRSKGID